MTSRETSVRVLRAAVLGLSGLALFFWLCSYSWIVGLTPPTAWISASASPWLVAEIAAATAGGISLCAGLLLLWGAPKPDRQPLLGGAALGGFVMALTLLSLMMPA